MPARLSPLCLLLFAAVTVPGPSDACAPAPPPNVVVEIASESAVIVWDASNRTQHFIRRAAFDARASGGKPVKDFGFLVPTPSHPALEAADDEAFHELARVTARRVVFERGAHPGCAVGCGGGSGARGAPEPVQVLEEKNVAGYDATVLLATDAPALREWLKAHGYESRPALTEWLRPYVEKRWVVTAFKVARDPEARDNPGPPDEGAWPGGDPVIRTEELRPRPPAAPRRGALAGPDSRVRTGAVRMSFSTDEPFYPYTEPSDSRNARGGRLLRVYFLGDKKVEGRLGQNQWPGKVAWAGRLPAVRARAVAELLKIPGYAPGGGTWLTEFEDESSPRPGDSDVTFAVSAGQEPVERATKVIPAPRADAGGRAGVALLAAGIAGVYLLIRLRFASRA